MSELDRPALRAFSRIAELWGLSSDEQAAILGVSMCDIGVDPLPSATLETISYTLGVYAALRILTPDKQSADTWIRRPNKAPVFGGKPAIDLMTTGRIADVRRYLDAMIWAGH